MLRWKWGLNQDPSIPPAVHSWLCTALQVLAAALGDAAGSVDTDVMRRLTADVAMELNALRNAAYANGFTAAKGAIAGVISKQFA